MYAACGFKQEMSFLSVCDFWDTKQKDMVGGFNMFQPIPRLFVIITRPQSQNIDPENRKFLVESSPPTPASWQGLS